VKHTHKNDALFACESGAVMGCSDCGGFEKGGNLP
jgi:hypothetical protein